MACRGATRGSIEPKLQLASNDLVSATIVAGYAPVIADAASTAPNDPIELGAKFNPMFGQPRDCAIPSFAALRVRIRSGGGIRANALYAMASACASMSGGVGSGHGGGFICAR